MEESIQTPPSNGFYDALQNTDDDTVAGNESSSGQMSVRATTMTEGDAASDKLGTINVLGMGRTASQDKAAASRTNVSGGTFSSSLALFSDPSISPALRSIELPHSAFTSSVDQTHPATSSVSTIAGRPSGPLKHKDSFGQHSSVPMVLDGSSTGTETAAASPFQSRDDEVKDKDESKFARSGTEEVTTPAAFVDSLWGTSKNLDDTPVSLPRSTSGNGSLAVSNSATLGGPISPFSQGQLPSGPSISSSTSFSQQQAERIRRPEEVNKEGDDSTVTKTTADNKENREVRTREKEATPRKGAARQVVSTKAATSNDTTTASPATAGASTTTPTVGTKTAGAGSSKTTRAATHRAGPQLPSAPNVASAPPPAMYWSRVPVHGSVPKRSFRAHTANLADEILWLFGGCDSKGCFRELWCFDTETMCWSKPKVTGDLPPPRRAHSATMVDKRLFVFAGGDGPYYFNDLYVFDTISLRWSKPDVYGQAPSPRRAHTSNYYNGQLIIFGGGNGVGALNDVFSLDVADPRRLEWKKVECKGKMPIGRGYHTSNLVDGKLIVIGGSDGHMSFNDIHILRLDTKTWYQVKTDEIHNRLGHTATQVGSYLFIVGGHDSHSYTPEILTLNLVNLQWEPRRVCGKKPPGRGYHQAWLRDSRLFVHGGFDGKEIYDDLYFIDLAACAYLPQITSFSVELDDE